MEISFPHDRSGVYTLNGTVAFPAVVNGHNVSCEISEEALKQCFACEPSEELSKAEYDLAMVAAFESARDTIEAAAEKCLRQRPDRICLLGPEDFGSRGG